MKEWLLKYKCRNCGAQWTIVVPEVHSPDSLEFTEEMALELFTDRNVRTLSTHECRKGQAGLADLVGLRFRT